MDIFRLDREISANQGWPHKGVTYTFFGSRGQFRTISIRIDPQNFPGPKSGWFGAFLEKRSILVIFRLDSEISANQGWPHKGVTYTFFGSPGQKLALSVGFGPQNFPGPKFGWFWAYLKKRSILVNFQPNSPFSLSEGTPQ